MRVGRRPHRLTRNREMTLYPAVDILGGRAVRLTQGDYDAETVYRDDPLQAATTWVQEGARALHVVDLDGARAGRPVALEHLREIARQAVVPVQYGGGLRTLADVEAALEAGAARVVLGTAAFRDEELLDRALERHGDRVAVAVDVRGGEVAVSGWTAGTGTAPTKAIAALQRKGVRDLVYTNVDRDGMLSGPDLDEVEAVSAAAGDARLICSGGVGSLDDLRAIAALALPNLSGVIVGKALYERRFTVAEALRALGETAS